MVPTPRLAWLAALGIPLVLLGLFGTTGLVVAAMYDGVLLAAVVLDRIAAGSPARLRIERAVSRRWVQGRPESVRLPVRWEGRIAGRFLVRDLAPDSFRAPPPTLVLRLGPAHTAELRYEVCALERGTQTLGPVTVRSLGPLGLVERRAVVEVPAEIRVYPNLVSLTAREAALVSPSAWRAGTRRGRVHGEGREFHQLRDYAAGDDVRLLDWKAYAHRGKPAVREYRAERNQRILLLIDGGRLMTVRVGDRLRFDWAVQAAGRLARVALAMGDAVGLAVYSREVRSRLPAARGPRHLGQLADLLADARPDLEEPDLGRSIRTLLRGSFRRTLVVVFTEIADPRAAAEVVRHVGALAPRHLGLVVTLFDADLEAERQIPVVGPDSAYRRVAADELWQDTLRTERALHARGALVVRARADALAADTVERYVEVKRLGRL